MLVAFPDFLAAQEFILFETENGYPDKIFGWDMFEAFYPQPHPNSIGNAGGALTVEPAGGLISSTANLYAFMTMPACNFTISGLNSDQPFTSIAIQVATTEIIDKTRFTESPSDFIELGVRSVLSFEGDDINVNYYWVEWRGLPASNSYEFTMPGMEQHVIFTGT